MGIIFLNITSKSASISLQSFIFSIKSPLDFLLPIYATKTIPHLNWILPITMRSILAGIPTEKFHLLARAVDSNSVAQFWS